MAKNLVRKVFYSNCNWTAPAGVTSVKVYGVSNKVANFPYQRPVDTDAIITNENALYIWGKGTSGQIGNGAANSVCVPVNVCPTIKFKDVTIFGNSVVAQTTSGELYAWGSNTEGVLGAGTTNAACTPTLVCGGNVRPTDLSGIGLNNNSFVIDVQGKLWTWGVNGCGVLGDGTTSSKCVPVNICPTLRFKCIGGLIHSKYAITCDGALYAWGCNNQGQLGIGSIAATCVPTIVCSGLSFSQIKSFANGTGCNKVFAVTSQGSLYTWGVNICGTLANGCAYGSFTCLPVCVPVAACFDLSSSSFYTDAFGKTLIRACDGRIFSGGNNNLCGMLGQGDLTGRCVMTPMCCDILFKSFQGQNTYVNAFGCDGYVYGWGGSSCNTGVCYCGVANCIPMRVCHPVPAKEVFFCTSGRSFLINCCGELFGWGANGTGALGLGCTDNVCTPIKVCCDLKVKRLYSYSSGTVALTCDGNLYVWGNQGNAGGICAIIACVPTKVCSNEKWSDYALISNTSSGVSKSGTLFKWGESLCGTVGEGTNSEYCYPVETITPNNLINKAVKGEISLSVVPNTEYTLNITAGSQSFGSEIISTNADFIVLEYFA